MMLRKKWLFTAFLLLIALLVHAYSRNPHRVEMQYSLGFFPRVASVLRFLFGWMPFSLGDLLYGGIILFLLIKFFGLARRKEGGEKPRMPRMLKKALDIFLMVYIGFNLLWGLNYNRLGISTQLGLKDSAYTRDDLTLLNQYLLQKVNDAKMDWIKTGEPYPTKKILFEKVGRAYGSVTKDHAFLQYTPVSLKPSVWSWVGNYLGFTGYYNPFTGEAQVNTTIPKFLQPYTACHEVAHQLGYAKEMEANFVGFLAAEKSSDPLLHYSVYLDLFFYANRNLYQADSLAANRFRDSLSAPIQKDLLEWRAFRLKHRSFAEPLFRWVYGKFLERNEQPQGMLAYDEVTSFLISYYKKQGILNITSR